MRISDWSSDVCSSDLVPPLSQQARTREAPYPKPCLLEAARDHLGGARLGPGELRVGVQVPPDLDQLGGALLDDVRDQFTGFRHDRSSLVVGPGEPAGDRKSVV